MDIIATVWSFLTHLDTELGALLAQYGVWVYAILFAIIFCETGLVVTPFLPGDSLLFVSGAVWASADMPVEFLMATLIGAALCGDNCNYWIGRALSSRARQWEGSRLFNRRLFDRTEAFYARHGGKTVILARFVPLVRTFAPFVAGVGRMSYARFLLFSIVGALLWVILLVSAGFLFGNLPIVRDNFEIAVLGVVALSLVPVALEIVRHRRGGTQTATSRS